MMVLVIMHEGIYIMEITVSVIMLMPEYCFIEWFFYGTHT